VHRVALTLTRGYLRGAHFNPIYDAIIEFNGYIIEGTLGQDLLPDIYPSIESTLKRNLFLP